MKRGRPAVLVGPSLIHGVGVFAERRLRKGQFVVEYVGERVREPVAQLRQARYGNGTFLFSLERVRRQQQDEEQVLDATWCGNQARFLNHSCDPNCALRLLELSEGQTVAVIYALKEVPELEELTIDYRLAGEAPFRCHCASKSCQGRPL
jgi:histone-lysine N-methyltransferase SETD1